VQRYGPELEQRLRRHLKPTNKSWRGDETYLRVKGRWCYPYRALDSKGATIDFLLSALPTPMPQTAVTIGLPLQSYSRPGSVASFGTEQEFEEKASFSGT
jgi:hypothetical protein